MTEKTVDIRAGLDNLLGKIMERRGSILGYKPEEIKQLDEDAVMQFSIDVMTKQQETGELIAPVGAIYTELKWEMSMLKELKSMLQSILRTIRDQDR
jgi:hypothetical protein